MKRFVAAIFSVAALAPAADFFTGQAARVVIGQKTFTSQDSGASDVLMGGVGGVAVAGDMLFVTDANRIGATPLNHRVLIFRNVSSKLPGLRDPIDPDVGRCPICTGRADVVLGQPDFEKTELSLSQTGLRLPLGVASDGKILAVADTDNNRVLIWRNIPLVNNTPADVVVGQPDFKTAVARTTQEGMRGPQSVWIQDGRLIVADTSNDRILIWNTIPTTNGQKADLVLGQPNFTTVPPQNLAQTPVEPKANTLLTPTSVTSDGRRLFVTDLGHNRVLIWNTFPTSNQQPADVVVGQPDMESATGNNSSKLCPVKEQDEDGNDVYPTRCAATLSWPRYALSDGQRLFIADAGNDRVLVFDQIPTANGQRASFILGQAGEETNQVSDSAEPLRRSSSDSLRTPLALAWDGANLFVTDPYNRRVMVFSPADNHIPLTGVRNLASREIYAVGSIAFSGTVTENDSITVTIGEADSGEEREYTYKIVKADIITDAEGDFSRVINKLVLLINAGTGDREVLATPNLVLGAIILTARAPGPEGNNVNYSTSTSDNAKVVLTTGGSTLSGGMDAAKIAPGTLVAILGDNFTDQTDSAPDGVDFLPKELAGVQVYFDGIRAPLLMVSPTQINAQIPYEVLDATSINAYVLTRWRDGRTTVTTPAGVPIIEQNPGVFAEEGADPRRGIIMHYSSRATGTISVDGTATAGDKATIKIEDREYSYTVKQGDTLESIRDGLIALINGNPEEKVEAYPAGIFTRVRLRAKVAGPEGNGIVYSGNTAEGAQVILTATTPALCCANVAGSRVTETNPALPGETIVLLATGLGIVKPDDARWAIQTGGKYWGPQLNEPVEFVSSLAGGKTANVLYCGLQRGSIGIYEVHLELNSDIPTNPVTQLTIAQDVYVSNIVTVPVFNPNPASTSQ